MKMTITTRTEPSPVDMACIDKAASVLRSLLDYYHEDGVLINCETGEVVEMSEIPRVLGILSAFAEPNNWEIRQG